MKFLIQHNLINPDQLLIIKDAVAKYPHEFVGLIPFSHEIMGDTPIMGTGYIPYGSTAMISVAQQLGWDGLFFDPDQFTYEAALNNRGDMLNSGLCDVTGAVDMLRRAEPSSQWFIRPSADLKQFSGMVIGAEEGVAWLSSALASDSSAVAQLTPETKVILCEPKPIQAEWRWFVVGGKVVSGSMYRAHGQMRKQRVTERDMIAEAQEFANGWLPSPCCVMDLALVNGEVKVIEFNNINSSGLYDNDANAIFSTLYEYCTK